jgi:type IV pilus assembly protein PilW
MTSKHALKTVNQLGFTLIEMMIALTIGVLLILALATVVVSASDTGRVNGQNAELQTNGRYGLDVLKRDIQQAGYAGLRGRGISNLNAPAVTSDCLPGFAANVSQRIWGSNNGANPFDLAACPQLANMRANTDILVVRYLSTGVDVPAIGGTALTTCQSATGAVCYRSNYKGGAFFKAGDAPPSLVDTAQDHTLAVSLYYVNNNTNAADGIPSLRRFVLSNAGAMTDEVVVSGVENFQVQYARSTGTTQYSNATDIEAIGVVAAAMVAPVTPAVSIAGDSVTAWGDVNAVRLWLLVRNGTPEPAPFVNTTPYALGDVNIPAAGDRFRRQVFTSTLQLRN